MKIDKLDIETARYILHLRNQPDIAEAAVEALLKSQCLNFNKEMPVTTEAQVCDPINETLDLTSARAAKNAVPISALYYKLYNLMFL